jgi:hypothetical protein
LDEQSSHDSSAGSPFRRLSFHFGLIKITITEED